MNRATSITIAALLIGAAGSGALALAGRIDLRPVLADASRPEADRDRDADRKPAETIAFSRLRKGHKVAELAPGGGYYTRLLSGAVGPKGHVYAIAATPRPPLVEFDAAHANMSILANQPGQIPVPAPVDMVWTTNNYHDFKNVDVNGTDGATLLNAAAFRALKPGGIYLISDHQAAPGAGATQTRTLHRIESAAVKREVEAAGFRLEAESPILRHAADDHSLRVQETGIFGKTDRFVMRFRKPKR